MTRYTTMVHEHNIAWKASRTPRMVTVLNISHNMQSGEVPDFYCHHLRNYNWRGSLGLIAATSLSLAFTGLLLLLLGEWQFGLLEFALGHRL